MTEIGRAISAVLAAFQGNAAPPSGPLTLDQAIAIAENQAFAVKLQETAIEKQRQRVNEARGNLGPQIALGGNYTRYDQEVTASLGPGQGSIVIQPIDVKTATATMTWAIDIAGNKTRLLHANEAQKRSADLTLKATYNDTRLNVRQAYFAVLRAKAQIDVDEKALADAQGRLDQGKKQYDQQQVARLDVTRYQAQVAQSTADLIAAKDSLELANHAFNQALARPIQTPVNLVDVTDLPVLKSSVEDLVRAGQAKRPEVISAKENLYALALITRATESTMNPSLNFQLQYERTYLPEGFTAVPELTTGMLILNIPVFDSGITRARVKQARQDETTAKIELQQTQLQISQEVRDAIANLNSAKARLDNAIEQVRLATEVFRLAQVRQDAGAGTYYEVIDAESQLTLARNGEVSARYDYLSSYSQLQRAVGSDDVSQAVMALAKTPKGGK